MAFSVNFGFVGGPIFRFFFGCVLDAPCDRFGSHLGGPGAARGDQKPIKKGFPKRKRSGDENRSKKRFMRVSHRPKIVKNLLGFIIFSENRSFGAQAAAEIEKAAKMIVKSPPKRGAGRDQKRTKKRTRKGIDSGTDFC